MENALTMDAHSFVVAVLVWFDFVLLGFGVIYITFASVVYPQVFRDTRFMPRIGQGFKVRFASIFASIGILKESTKAVPALVQIVLENSEQTLDSCWRIEC